MKNKFSHELLIVRGYGCIGVLTLVRLLLYLFEIFHEKKYFVTIAHAKKKKKKEKTNDQKSILQNLMVVIW